MDLSLLMCDVDGTLLGEDGWKPGAVDLVREAGLAGLRVALCSGRPKESLLMLAGELPEVTYLAAGGGSVVLRRDGDAWTVVGVRFLPPEVVAEVEARAAEIDMEVWAYTPEAWLVTAVTPRVEHDIAFTRVEAVEVDGFAGQPVVKLLMFARTPEQRSLLIDLDGRRELAVVESYPGYEDLCLAVTAATKGGDLVTADLGIDWPAVAACGDGQNDLGMLSKANLALLMRPLRTEMLAPARAGQTRHECADLTAALGLLQTAVRG